MAPVYYAQLDPQEQAATTATIAYQLVPAAAKIFKSHSFNLGSRDSRLSEATSSFIPNEAPIIATNALACSECFCGPSKA